MAKQIIDYTKMRKGTRINAFKVDYCPKCGKKGVKRSYSIDILHYVHKSHVEFIFEMIDESCFVKVVKE